MIDTTRSGIAYLLIGLLPLAAIGLPAIVALGAIAVGGGKEFDVILAPLVPPRRPPRAPTSAPPEATKPHAEHADGS